MQVAFWKDATIMASTPPTPTHAALYILSDGSTLAGMYIYEMGTDANRGYYWDSRTITMVANSFGGNATPVPGNCPPGEHVPRCLACCQYRC
jgi:hypothetical protein